MSLGEKLRAAREERGISISEVAEQTRISPLYIEGIEKDDFKLLPGGIFNKGFVRSFAKYVGVDEQEALQDYARQTAVSDPNANPDEPRAYRPEVLTDDRSSSMLPTIIFAGIILALMTGGILFLVNYIQNQPAKPTTANTNATPAPGNTDVVANPTPTTDASGVPAWETVKIEFKAVTEPISLGSTVDGKNSESMLQPDQPVVFEPKENLKLRYARSKAPFATLSINGKAITLPAEPANPKRAAIEFDINKNNLAQIWQAGAITFGGAAAPAANVATTSTPAPTGTQPTANTTAPVTNTASPAANSGKTTTTSPRPAFTPAKPAPKPSLTPIIVGRPANGAAAKPTP
jgi:cytoskeleton protein RodZ